MSDKPYIPAVIETEDEMLDRLFFPEFHGEVRIEYYDGKVLVINWYDNYPLNSCIYNLDNDRAKFWASTFVRLHEEYVKQRTEADFAKKLVEENQHLKEQVALLKQKIFGASSEQTTIPTIENKEVQIESIDINIAAQNFTHQDKKLKLVSSNAGRKPLPANLPRERVEYKLPQEKQFCECCSGKLHEFGEEMTERLTVIPAKYKVIQHVRQKYVCRNCDKFTVAEGPKSLIPGSSYSSPEFLADVAVKRYQFGLPYYRQETIFNHAGLPFNRTTLANLMIGCVDKLQPLYAVLKSELRNQDIVHADETTFQVLKESNRTPQSNSYAWLYRSAAKSNKPVVLFEYQATRSGHHPLKFLTGDDNDRFKGYLSTDGYSGYNNISGVTRVGCMAHVRRKFDEAIKILPTGTENSYAHQAIKMIANLYGIERKISDQPPEIKYKIRQAESLPILHEMKQWLDKLYPDVVPKNLLGKAINYALSQWSYVSKYVEDGRLAIDNNIAEREIKAFVIGRKNWLFADSTDGAEANAVMYSLVQTAIANGIEPYKYLCHVFERMPYMKNSRDVESLLPWNVKFADNENLRIAA
jgi:transposase